MSHAKHLLDRRLGLFCKKKIPLSRNTYIFRSCWLKSHLMQKGFFFPSIFLHSQVMVMEKRDQAFLSFMIILKNWHGQWTLPMANLDVVTLVPAGKRAQLYGQWPCHATWLQGQRTLSGHFYLLEQMQLFMVHSCYGRLDSSSFAGLWRRSIQICFVSLICLFNAT